MISNFVNKTNRNACLFIAIKIDRRTRWEVRRSIIVNEKNEVYAFPSDLTGAEVMEIFEEHPTFRWATFCVYKEDEDLESDDSF